MNGQSLFIRPSFKLPRISSRRLKQIPFCNVAYLTDPPTPPAPPATPKEDKRTAEELLNEIQKRFDKSLEGIATKEEITQIREEQKVAMKDVAIEDLRELLDKTNGVMALMSRSGLEVKRLKNEIEKMSSRQEDMSLRGQITRWVKENEVDIKAIQGKQRNRQLTPMQLRLDSPMFVSTVNSTGSQFIGKVQVESGMNDFLRIQPNFWDYIKKGRTNSPTYVWVNKTNPQGAAAFIGPGVAKPGVSFRLIAETSTAKKIADSAKAGTELLQDIEGMESFIEDELKYQIMIRLNTAVMTDVSSTTNINGIQTLSVPFPLNSGIFTMNPNIMDAIRAGIGYMRSGLLVGPITVFINPIDAANMDLTKSVNSGVYLMPPFVTANGMNVSGASIVEDYNIPVGKVQFAFLNYYRILIYQDLYIEWGWENDDFTKNLVTAIGEMRIHQFMNSIYTGAFMFDTFANIQAAITAI